MEGFATRDLVIISEPAVYKLAFRSNKSEADAFTNWVVSEVLPAIRKSGRYTPPAAMNEKQAIPRLALVDDRPVTTSFNVAKVFDKRHDDIIRAIESSAIPEKYRLSNFGETVTERPNPSGGAPVKSKTYFMTRDGFTLLAMGFTGKQAMQFKVAYIEAFNALEEKLKNQQQPTPSELPLTLKRFIGSFDVQGRFTMREIDPCAYVFAAKDLPMLLADSGFHASKELLAEIAKVAAARTVVGAYYAQKMFQEK